MRPWICNRRCGARARALSFCWWKPIPAFAPPDIAKILVRDRPAISRVIAPLVDAGLIEQRIVANERRATGLYITEEGKKAAALAKTVVTEQADEFFSSMPREDKVELERILKDLFRVVSARG